MLKWRVVRSYGKGVKEDEAWRVEPERGMTQSRAVALMRLLDRIDLDNEEEK
jgi:hypothetical protein